MIVMKWNEVIKNQKGKTSSKHNKTQRQKRKKKKTANELKPIMA